MKNSIKFALILFTLGLFSFSSCSDDDSKPEPTVVNKYLTGVDLTKQYQLLPSSAKFAKDSYFALGYGYDITNRYAHPDGVKAQVIDLKKTKDNVDYYILGNGSTSFGAGDVASGTLDDVKRALLERSLGLKNINASEGYKNAFNAIFDTFKADSSFQNINYYYRIQNYNARNYRYQLNADSVDDILNHFYLSDTFLQDVNTLSADAIVEKYGTHVMTDVVFGWRRDYYYRSTSDQNILGRQLGAMAKVLGSSMGLGILSSNTEEAKEDKENLYTEYVDGVYAKDVPNAWMFDVTNYSGEIKYDISINQTFDADNLVLINWGNSSHPLIPIYEFVADATKKEAVKKAFEDYLNK